MSAIEPAGIWKYKDKRFDTKVERDYYQRGYEDALKDMQDSPIDIIQDEV